MGATYIGFTPVEPVVVSGISGVIVRSCFYYPFSINARIKKNNPKASNNIAKATKAQNNICFQSHFYFYA